MLPNYIWQKDGHFKKYCFHAVVGNSWTSRWETQVSAQRARSCIWMGLTTSFVDNRKQGDRVVKSQKDPLTLCHTHCCYQHINNLLPADPSKSILTLALPTTSALQGTGLLCQGLKTFNPCWSCSSCLISKTVAYFKISIFLTCSFAGSNDFGLTTVSWVILVLWYKLV